MSAGVGGGSRTYTSMYLKRLSSDTFESPSKEGQPNKPKNEQIGMFKFMKQSSCRDEVRRNEQHMQIKESSNHHTPSTLASSNPSSYHKPPLNARKPDFAYVQKPLQKVNAFSTGTQSPAPMTPSPPLEKSKLVQSKSSSPLDAEDPIYSPIEWKLETSPDNSPDKVSNTGKYQIDSVIDVGRELLKDEKFKRFYEKRLDRKDDFKLICYPAKRSDTGKKSTITPIDKFDKDKASKLK